MSGDENGRIKLTWPQTVWAITILVLMATGWARMEYRMSALETTLSERVYTKADIDRMKYMRDRDLELIRLEVEAKTARRLR